MLKGTKFIQPDFAALIIIVMAVVVRMLIATGQQLSFDEAYYWTWSQHLDYWYYDQGPMIAWIIRLFTLFASSVVTVKLVAITCSSVFLYFGYRLISELIDARTGLYWLAVIMSTPLFLLGGAISTYDAPMLMFWSAASFFGYRALMTGHLGYWLTAGFISALGVLSKLPTLALPVGIFLTCIATPDGRKKLATPYPWLAGTIALLPLLLLKYWDDTHAHLFTLHSASLSKRHTDAAFGRWTGDLIAGQLLVLGPTTFIGVLWALLRHRSSENTQTRTYISMMSIPLLVVCLLLSTKSKLEVNWPIAAYFTGVIPLATFLVTARFKRFLLPALLVPGLVISLIAGMPDALGAIGIRLKPALAVKLYEPYGWNVLRDRFSGPASSVVKSGGFVASTNYRMTAMTAWLLGSTKDVECLFAHTRNNQFVIWSQLDNRAGQNALLILDDVDIKDLQHIKKYFDTVTEVGSPIAITSPAVDGPIRTIHLYECTNFHGYKIKDEAIGY